MLLIVSPAISSNIEFCVMIMLFIESSVLYVEFIFLIIELPILFIYKKNYFYLKNTNISSELPNITKIKFINNKNIFTKFPLYIIIFFKILFFILIIEKKVIKKYIIILNNKLT